MGIKHNAAELPSANLLCTLAHRPEVVCAACDLPSTEVDANAGRCGRSGCRRLATAPWLSLWGVCCWVQTSLLLLLSLKA